MGKTGIIFILIFLVGVLWSFALYWTDFAKKQGFETLQTITEKK